MRRAVLGLLLLLFASIAPAQQHEWCTTPSPPSEKSDWFSRFGEQARYASRPKASLSIPIAFHVITDGKKGKLTAQQISILIQNLNWAYRDAPFSFYLYKAETTKNPAWYNDCLFNTANQQKIRKRLAKDSRFYVNIYSCKLGVPGLYGVSTFPPGYPVPGNPGTTFMQGIAIDPVTVGGSEIFQYGLVLAHEIGHYLGLFHTFERAFNSNQTACADPGDFIPDTPTQATHTLGSCPLGLNTCPALAGADDIPNFMNYATDACWDHFSRDQIGLMVQALQQLRPTLGSR